MGLVSLPLDCWLIEVHFEATFHSLYRARHLFSNKVHLFERGDRRGKAKDMAVLRLDDPLLEEAIGNELYLKLMEDAELLDDLIEPLDLARVAAGDQSPMFFGSAMVLFMYYYCGILTLLRMSLVCNSYYTK
jgi:peptide subunit release factor RF-3